MNERIPGMLERLSSLERHTEHLEGLWRSSVDDIKATIRSEIRDLKDEQIADLKRDLAIGHERSERLAERLVKLERRQDQWAGGAGAINWLIRAGIAIAGILAGFFGGQHIK